jgi:hypothetical protein
MKKKLFIHVGMPKCGSSAIQSLLSNSDFYQDNKHILYVSIDRFGNLLYGDKLFQQAKRSIFQYSSSVEISHLLKLDQDKRKAILNKFELLFQNFETIIISNEGWGVKPHEVNQFFETFFSMRSFEIDIIGFIRPQVEWFNSAWWQWGAWTGHTFDHWLDRTIDEASWFKHIEMWNSFNWVNNVHFSLLNSHMISGFLSKIRATFNENSIISNQSSPKLLLRFFQLNREFRVDAHDSGKEFALNRWLNFQDKATPFVIEKKNIEKIQTFHKDANERLIDYLSEEDKKLFQQENSKWFFTLSYEKKNILQSSPESLTNMEYQTLLVTSENAINILRNKCKDYKINFLDEDEQLEINNQLIKNIKMILLLDECIRKQ